MLTAAESYCTFELPPPFVWKVGAVKLPDVAAERSDRDSSKDVAVTTTIPDQNTLAQHEYDRL